MPKRFSAEQVHISDTRRLDTEDVCVSPTRRFGADEVFVVATRRPSAKEVFVNGSRRAGAREIYISGYEVEPTPEPTYHLTFDGVDDKIVIPHAASIDNLPLGDFTVEFVGSVAANPIDEYSEIFYKADEDEAGWYISTDLANMTFEISYDGRANVINSGFATPVGVHHFEFVYHAATKETNIFLDGAEVTYAFRDLTPGTTLDDDSAIPLTIYGWQGDGYRTVGQLNWARVSNVARHISNFTPPSLTEAPADDANTVLLLALDEGTGTVANDTSGNNNDGTITGATWVAD